MEMPNALPRRNVVIQRPAPIVTKVNGKVVEYFPPRERDRRKIILFLLWFLLFVVLPLLMAIFSMMGK
jgi:hypothetical protein